MSSDVATTARLGNTEQVVTSPSGEVATISDLAGLVAAHRRAREEADRAAKYRPGAAPPDTCRYCGKHRIAWAGVTVDGHARCVVSLAFASQVLSFLERTPSVTMPEAWGALGVSEGVLRCWVRWAIDARSQPAAAARSRKGRNTVSVNPEFMRMLEVIAARLRVTPTRIVEIACSPERLAAVDVARVQAASEAARRAIGRRPQERPVPSISRAVLDAIDADGPSPRCEIEVDEHTASLLEGVDLDVAIHRFLDAQEARRDLAGRAL